MAHPARLDTSRVRPESVGRDIARLLAPAYAGLLDDKVPEAFAAILGRMGSPDDIALRLIALAGSEAADELTWASYERRADSSRSVGPRWRMRPRLPLQH